MVSEKTEEVNSEMEILKKKGYLKDFYPKKIVDPRLSQLDYLINNRVEGITLQVTQQCNMRCSYCKFTYGDNVHSRAHATVSMSYDVAVRAIDFYYNHSRDSKHVNVSFYGGEPLLEYEMVKRIIAYVNNKFEGKPTEDIQQLVQYNISKVYENAEFLIALCDKPMNFETILQQVFAQYNLVMNYEQYALLGSTIKSSFMVKKF